MAILTNLTQYSYWKTLTKVGTHWHRFGPVYLLALATPLLLADMTRHCLQVRACWLTACFACLNAVGAQPAVSLRALLAHMRAARAACFCLFMMCMDAGRECFMTERLCAGTSMGGFVHAVLHAAPQSTSYHMMI